MKKFFLPIVLIISFIMVGSTSAVTYQTGVGVGFTFNPTLSINLSSADILIPNLAPGNSSDSNTITVTVNTNTAYGYTLNATVGEATNYNTRNLIRSDINDNFASIDYGSSLASITTDNTWGYSYKPSGQSSTWTTYSGLPLYNDTENVATLISTEDAANSDSIEFKIAAKASTTQPAGDYKNVINFIAVSNPAPLTLEGAYEAAGKTKLNGYYKMQDMNASICADAEMEDDQMQAIDIRDNKVYWIAKLKDGHCWMTQNLDLDLEPDPTNVATLTSENTDLNEFGANGYIYNETYSCSNSEPDCANGIITWQPQTTTITVTYDSSMKGTFPSFGAYYYLPMSLDVGDWYYAGYDGTTLLTSTAVNYLTSDNRVISSGVTTVNDGNGLDYFSTRPFTVNGSHGHVGNYYNWTAAIASNNSSGFVDSTLTNPDDNPKNSICPAGWRLPTRTNASPTFDVDGSRDEYARLANLYANYVGNSSISSAGLEGSPLFFVRGGSIGNTSLNFSGKNAFYFTSSPNSCYAAYALTFENSRINVMDGFARQSGYSVRCLAR